MTNTIMPPTGELDAQKDAKILLLTSVNLDIIQKQYLTPSIL